MEGSPIEAWDCHSTARMKCLNKKNDYINFFISKCLDLAGKRVNMNIVQRQRHKRGGGGKEIGPCLIWGRK